MRTYDEVYAAAVRAHEIARLLVYVGDAYGNPASVEDVMKWFMEMTTNPRYRTTTAIGSGLLMLSRDSDDMGFFTLYVNVGPAISDREDM